MRFEAYADVSWAAGTWAGMFLLVYLNKPGPRLAKEHMAEKTPK